MADIQQKVPESIEGEFFVDCTCIDCDTCRQLAPEIFGDTGEFSFVKYQPTTDSEVRDATRALLACPVGSIGTVHANQAKAVMTDFPLPLDEKAGVYYCGFNSPKSFGGNSYFARHPDGNWLVDSPKYLPHLVRAFEAMGGIRYIFLTHQDDVADAADYARHFGAARIIHQAELRAQPDAEMVVEGLEAVNVGSDFRIIPVPGHTKGHCVLLYQERFLFTGDHLWWNPESNALGASSRYCWYSWPEQVCSMRRLLDERFEWVLPGHGDRHRLPAPEMHREMEALLSRIAG